jgi:hypothetical protein
MCRPWLTPEFGYNYQESRDRLAEVLFLMNLMYAWYWLSLITTAVLRDRLGDHVFQPKSQLQHGRLWTTTIVSRLIMS